MRVKSIPIFLTLRAIRIFPALCVEVVIFALIIGPFLTELSIQEYYQDKNFHRYFLNTIGDIHYYLPGAFNYNPTNQVNTQLWTVPSELRCYILISILGLTTVIRSPAIFGIAALAYNVYAYYKDVVISRYLVALGSPTSNLNISCFLWGVFIYLNRSRISDSITLLLASVSGIVLSLYVIPDAAYFSALPIAYATIYLEIRNPTRVKIIESGDYSYGLYLYGFPIQQTFYIES